jgi:hypothetical protein
MSAKLKFKATIRQPAEAGGDLTVNIIGRDGWALLHLLAAGPKGITTLERPAPRWSAYIFKLRRAGIAIETSEEGHKGTFAGTHGRYTLTTDLFAWGGNLAEWLASDEGRREFPHHDFLAGVAA